MTMCKRYPICGPATTEAERIANMKILLKALQEFKDGNVNGKSDVQSDGEFTKIDLIESYSLIPDLLTKISQAKDVPKSSRSLLISSSKSSTPRLRRNVGQLPSRSVSSRTSPTNLIRRRELSLEPPNQWSRSSLSISSTKPPKPAQNRSVTKSSGSSTRWFC